MQRVFYKDGFQVIDVSGEKSVQDIEREFGGTGYSQHEIDERTEFFSIKDNRKKTFRLDNNAVPTINNDNELVV